MNNHKVKDCWYTPSELLELYPKIANLYTPQRLGYLAYGGAITYKKRPRGCLISEKSFLEFMQWRYGFNFA